MSQKETGDGMGLGELKFGGVIRSLKSICRNAEEKAADRVKAGQLLLQMYERMVLRGGGASGPRGVGNDEVCGMWEDVPDPAGKAERPEGGEPESGGRSRRWSGRSPDGEEVRLRGVLRDKDSA